MPSEMGAGSRFVIFAGSASLYDTNINLTTFVLEVISLQGTKFNPRYCLPSCFKKNTACSAAGVAMTKRSETF